MRKRIFEPILRSINTVGKVQAHHEMGYFIGSIMRPAYIRKSPADSRSSTIENGGETGAALSRSQLGALRDETLNIAYLAVDRHANSPLAEKTAFRFWAWTAPALGQLS